jgi:hypothetical protein
MVWHRRKASFAEELVVPERPDCRSSSTQATILMNNHQVSLGSRGAKWGQLNDKSLLSLTLRREVVDFARNGPQP